MSKTKNVGLHPGQWKAIQSDAKVVAMVSGSGSGKTFTGPKWLYKEISENPGEDWMIAAPTFNLLEDAALDEFWKFFKDTDLEGDDRGIRNKKRYDLPDGGRVYYRSTDRPGSLEAKHVKGIWADEAGQMTREVWHTLRRRIGQVDGRILLTTTPYSINWLKHEVFDEAFVEVLDAEGSVIEEKEGNRSDTYHVIQFPSILNPNYSKEEYEEMKDDLTKEEFDMFMKGKFTRMQGLVYPNFMEVVVDRDLYTPTESDSKIGAIDPGMSDPFGILTGVYGDDSKLHLRHEMYESDMLLSDLSQYLDPFATYYMDPAAKRERKELESMGFDVRKATNDLAPGVRKVQEFIHDDRMVVPEHRFPNLISEAKEYQYDKKKDKPDRNTPHHLLDCLRYLLMGLEDNAGLDIYIL